MMGKTDDFLRRKAPDDMHGDPIGSPARDSIGGVLDCVVIGGGSAGLAAAITVAESLAASRAKAGTPEGAGKFPARVLVLEREGYLGGVLRQCVHDGFGLHLYGTSLTGPEYARRWIDRAQAAGVRFALSTTALSVKRAASKPAGLLKADASNPADLPKTDACGSTDLPSMDASIPAGLSERPASSSSDFREHATSRGMMNKFHSVILKAKPEESPQVGALEIPRCARNDGLGRIDHHFPNPADLLEVDAFDPAALPGRDSSDPAGVLEVDAIGACLGGRRRLRARSVVVATGCRERTRGELMIPGERPAGVMTAGCAQYLMNVANQLPGDEAVILGSGDIGLIMARRLTLEGARVKLVLGQAATGLLRNHIACIQDFDIPIRFGWGVTFVHGMGQLEGVSIAPFSEAGGFDWEHEEFVPCNLLLIACGLVPEREVLEPAFSLMPGKEPEDAMRHPERSRGASRDSTWEDEAASFPEDCKSPRMAADPEPPNPPFDLAGFGSRRFDLATLGPAQGVFLCGNVSRPHDLVDQVSCEGARVGKEAARHVAAALGLPAPALPRDLARMVRREIAEPRGRLADVAGRRQDGVELMACTVCPTGCVLEVSRDGEVSGNACGRGTQFARDELACPKRLFTGTVRLESNAEGRELLPVRTSGRVPRDSLRAIARACAQIVATVPVRLGDVIIANVADSGVALVACDECVSGMPPARALATCGEECLGCLPDSGEREGAIA